MLQAFPSEVQKGSRHVLSRSSGRGTQSGFESFANDPLPTDLFFINPSGRLMWRLYGHVRARRNEDKLRVHASWSYGRQWTAG